VENPRLKKNMPEAAGALGEFLKGHDIRNAPTYFLAMRSDWSM